VKRSELFTLNRIGIGVGIGIGIGIGITSSAKFTG
jgi:hypothetical protein